MKIKEESSFGNSCSFCDHCIQKNKSKTVIRITGNHTSVRFCPDCLKAFQKAKFSGVIGIDIDSFDAMESERELAKKSPPVTSKAVDEIFKSIHGDSYKKPDLNKILNSTITQIKEGK
jgi:hypothetical protein